MLVELELIGPIPQIVEHSPFYFSDTRMFFLFGLVIIGLINCGLLLNNRAFLALKFIIVVGD